MNELKLNPKFQPLFEDNIDDPRYYQVYGGRASGKSFTVSIAAVYKTYSKYKHKILYLRQTMTSLEDSSIADIKSAIEDLGVGSDFRLIKNRIVNIKTGSEIVFKGIESKGSNSAKLKSLSGITTLIIEEAEDVKSYEEFGKVDESIRDKGKPLKVILLYNPKSSIGSWIHEEWFINGRPNPKRYDDTVFIHSTYLDNLENLEENYIKGFERKKIENPIYYRNTILAEWTLSAANRVYDGWQIYTHFKQDCDTWYGLDFGYGGKDKTALVEVKFFEDVYYVKQIFSKPNMDLNNIVNEMSSRGIPQNAKIFADSAVPLLIKEIRKLGYTQITKCQKGRVEAELKKVQSKEIVLITDGLDDIYKDYMTWSRDENGKLPHEPDVLAAMRYAINSKTPRKGAKAVRKKVRKRKGFV
jgi:phage terminase large subunit